MSSTFPKRKSDMSTVHELKCWPVPFAAMRDGTKRFEFRKDDRNYQVGDVLQNREWMPPVDGETVNYGPGAAKWVAAKGVWVDCYDGGEIRPDNLLELHGCIEARRGYTGREDRYRVTHKLAGRFGVPDGFCVLSIEPLAPHPDLAGVEVVSGADLQKAIGLLETIRDRSKANGDCFEELCATEALGLLGRGPQ